MRWRVKILALACVSITVAAGADNKSEGFRPGAASTFANKQTQKGLVVAAAVYQSDEETKPAFGKLNPNKYGVLPVLLVMENTGSEVLRLANLEVRYVDSRRRKISSIPAGEVRYLTPVDKPKVARAPIPGLNRGKKNPLAAEEIETRAFAAKMLPPGESAHGFFYFSSGHDSGAMLLVTGIEEAASGKELFYIEIPLE
ncbi:MAG: hypothetical protein R2762_02005 [Bryobacteraceae bacterium]